MVEVCEYIIWKVLSIVEISEILDEIIPCHLLSRILNAPVITSKDPHYSLMKPNENGQKSG